jgi:hypothetical protein
MRGGSLGIATPLAPWVQVRPAPREPPIAAVTYRELGPPNLIGVQTLDHVVYLSGEVSAGEFSAVAESAAHQVPGVTKVVNSISVAH